MFRRNFTFPWVPIAIQAVGIFHWILLRPIPTGECNWEERIKINIHLGDRCRARQFRKCRVRNRVGLTTFNNRKTIKSCSADPCLSFVFYYCQVLRSP